MSKLWGKLVDEGFSLGKYVLKEMFGDDGRYGKKYPRRTPLERFYLEISQYILYILGIMLVSTAIFRLLIIYNHLFYRYNLLPDLPDMYRDYVNIKLVLLTIATILLCGLYIYTYWSINKQKFPFNASLLISTLLIVFSLITIAPFMQEKLYQIVESEAFYQVARLRSSEQYEQALGILNPILKYSENKEVIQVAIREKAIIEASGLNEYQRSIETRLEFFSLNPDLMTDEDKKELLDSLYSLGGQLGIAEAEKILSEITHKYPYVDLNPLWLGASGTSPIWLGMSPTSYDLILNGDVHQLGNITIEERVKLQELISDYPDDPLVDWARLILGEHENITNNEPESKVRDWAIYKSGLEAYKNMDFQKSILYYTQFLEEFPNHRWSDDAGYRLARSFELSQNYEEALRYALLAEDFLDGNISYILEPYAVALIDVYFDSSQIQAYIDKEKELGIWKNLPILEFCLAEQLFKEGKYLESKEKFEEVKDFYPGSTAAEYVEHNLQLIEGILRLHNNPYPENIIELAEFFNNNSTSWSPHTLIYYNDLYEGSRVAALNNIGLGGPNIEYYKSTNDHLRAITILEEFIDSNPNHPLLPKALYTMNNAYYNLTYWAAFLPSHSGPLYIRATSEINNEEDLQIIQNLESITNKLLFEYFSSEYTPEALTVAAIGFANAGQLDKSREYMQKVIQNFPQHNLANNALIFNARLYSSPNEFWPTNQQCLYYQQAEAIYQQVLHQYPQGHVGREAANELEETRIKMNELGEDCN